MTTTQQFLTSEQLLTTMNLQKKVRKQLIMWMLLFAFILIVLAGIIALIIYIREISFGTLITALIAIILCRYLFISKRTAFFLLKTNRNLKKDIQGEKSNLTVGVIKSYNINNSVIVLTVGESVVEINFGAAFLFWKITYFDILTGKEAHISYLPASGLLYSIKFPTVAENAEEAILQNNAQRPQSKLSGIVTMRAVYKYAVMARGFSTTFSEKKVQIGNLLLAWKKDEIPAVGETIEIIINK